MALSVSQWPCFLHRYTVCLAGVWRKSTSLYFYYHY